MVIIVSEFKDITTNKVIEWLHRYDCTFKRLNFENYSRIAINLSSKSFNYKINDISFRVVWIRRGNFNTTHLDIVNTHFYSYLKNEESPVLRFFEKELYYSNKIIGSSTKEFFNNKILNLQIAKECGFYIPPTLVTNNKKELQDFYNENKQIISKSIFHPPNFTSDKVTLISGGTIEITQKEIDSMNDSFSLSLVQKKIEKQFEVRTFIFKDEIFSMAIFSQNDSMTKVDYRNYNKKKPNRNIPFKLPKFIKIKIEEMLKKMETNSGSIDFIVTPQNKFYFLEINPQGQIDALSSRCNYYIEKKIAKILVDF